MLKKWRDLSLGVKVLVGFIVGIILGLVFKEDILFVEVVGDIFINLLKMCIAPLVFFSIITGVSSFTDISTLKRIGSKTVVFYLTTTVISATIGVLLAKILKPGSGFEIVITDTEEYVANEMPTISETILGMIPTNPIESLANTNLIQTIVFCVFVGVALTLIGEKGKPVKEFCASASEMMFTVVGMIMKLAPYGTCALIASTLGTYGLDILIPVVQVLLAHYLAMAIVLFGVYGMMLAVFAKVNIFKFIKACSKVMLVSFSTASSAATLPISIDTAVNEMKVKSDLAEFTLPLGSTINLNGGVIYYCMMFMFVSQVYNIEMSMGQMIFIIATATFLAIGNAGVPGSGIMMVMILLTTMGLPLDLMGIIAGTNRFFDMGNTVVNCVGDLACTVSIAKSEDMMEKDSNLLSK